MMAIKTNWVDVRWSLGFGESAGEQPTTTQPTTVQKKNYVTKRNHENFKKFSNSLEHSHVCAMLTVDSIANMRNVAKATHEKWPFAIWDLRFFSLCVLYICRVSCVHHISQTQPKKAHTQNRALCMLQKNLSLKLWVNERAGTAY